jgi:serine O-acetyltransferase
MHQDIYSLLLHARQRPLVGLLAYGLLKLLGAEVPRRVPVGSGTRLEHGGFGVVIHSRARIGKRVKIYPSVTIGRADIHRPIESRVLGIEIEDDVILCPGAEIFVRKVCCASADCGGANAVLLKSTGEYEIWAGVPAHCVGQRDGS